MKSFYLHSPIKSIPMLKKFLPFAFSMFLFAGCASEGDICDCWKELVSKEGDRAMSDGCEYILDMTHDEITSEAGPTCVDEINKLLFEDDDYEYIDEIDENALLEGGDY